MFFWGVGVFWLLFLCCMGFAKPKYYQCNKSLKSKVIFSQATIEALRLFLVYILFMNF